MMTRAEPGRPTAILLLILLVLRLQPFALALLLPGPAAAPGPSRDSGLVAAIEDLMRAVRLQNSKCAAPTWDADQEPSIARVNTPTERMEATILAEPIAMPRDGVTAVPAAARAFPQNRERIEAWIRHERQRSARNGRENPGLLFHRTTDELLAAFGVPDVAAEQPNSVRWVYESEDGGSQFMLDIHAGRVYRFWFSE